MEQETGNSPISTIDSQRKGRARGHRPYQLSTKRAGTGAPPLSTINEEGGHGGTAPTNSQLSTLN
ncbi:MAG: hypothetical protein ACRC62_26705 [Microcoleus sp.]